MQTDQTIKRIEYIDAMRGVAMILVVYFHIAAYGFGSYEMGFNDVIERFRMPLFFFISGWVFYKAARIWDIQTVRSTISKKFKIQIIPTAVFLLLYLLVFDCLDFSFLGSDKKGYWFTFVLFEIFVIYIMAEALLNRRRHSAGEFRVMVVMILLSASALYYSKYYTRYAEELGCWKTILGLFSFVKIRHIIFFWFGTFVKRHFDSFIRHTDNWFFMVFLLGIVITLTAFPQVFSISGMEYFAYLAAGISGITVIFTYFRKCQKLFSHQNRFGKMLQLIGRRTLEIYLVHYFFLPYHIEWLAVRYNLYESPVRCMLISLVLASGVIAITMFVGSIIRRSPFLAKHLFGAKD